MKGAVPSAHTHASANYHCQKVWSGLKNALNKLSGEVTEENKGGLGKKWTHKYNDVKMVQDRGKSGTGTKAL